MWEAAVGVALALGAAQVGCEFVAELRRWARYDDVQHAKWEAGEMWFYGDRLTGHVIPGLSPPKCARPVD